MKKKIVLIFLLLAYILFYKLYISYQGQIMTYIVNPLAWLVFTFIFYFTFEKNKQSRNVFIFISIITITSLIYIIVYYGLGIVVGYTNNPYATSIDGIIINLFSLLLVICLREYIRYLLMKAKVKKYRIIYFGLVFLVFFIYDVSLINIVKNSNLLDLWARDLLVPIITNLIMMYIVYVSDYKAAVISRIIMILPTLVFRITPNYQWFAIIIFNIVYGLVSYMLIQYALNKEDNNVPSHFINKFHPARWIVTTIILSIVISFGAGFFNVKPVVILSGSMEPYISPGDMVIIDTTKIDDITVDDIIEFKVENRSVIHRVIKIVYENGSRRFITKGDANKAEDRFITMDGQVEGKLIFNVPYIGYPTYLIKNIVNNNDEINVERGDTGEKK